MKTSQTPPPIPSGQDDFSKLLARATVAQALGVQPPPVAAHATINLRHDSLIAIGTGVFCAIAMAVTATISVCSVIGVIVVGAVWGTSQAEIRKQDVERMAQTRGDVRELSQYKDQLLRRVGALENEKGECSE